MTLRKVCIVMNISTISYWFYEAFESMRKNIKNVLISVSTMFATMLIVAIGFIVFKNSQFVIDQEQDASSKVIAFLDYDVTNEKIEIIRAKTQLIDGVKDIEFYDSEKAIAYARSIENGKLTEGYDDETLKELFQPFFKITFETIEAEKEISGTLKSLDGVEDIRVSESAVESIKKAKSTRIIAITSMILIIELSVFLMVNTTKLMLYARRKEISIMKYVGAKDGFVKMPFAIEGVIMSLVAVFCVIVLISLCYTPVTQMINQKNTYQYMKIGELLPDLKTMLIIIGCFIGIFGSTMSMNKYLDV